MAEQLIIYPDGSGGVCVVVPSGVLTIAEVAQKDVPVGVPYKFVTRDEIPLDRTFRGAWEADFSSPDGHGIGADAFFANQWRN